MGMDVYGNNPTNETGEYWRSSVWGWRPLWQLCHDLVPDVVDDKLYEAGQYNDGAGPDAQNARILGHKLMAFWSEGLVHEWCGKLDATLDGLPDEKCEWCEGTGTRTDKVGVDMGYAARNWCNGCEGKGWRRPIGTSYRLHPDDVKDFAEFCMNSGGFAIL
jgi:hypothetical protein